MGIFDKRYDSKNKSGFDIEFKFKSPDDETDERWHNYDVPFHDYMEGIRAYFEMHDVNIDGTDKNIFNVLSSLKTLEELEEDEFFIDLLKEKCKDDAYEEFKEDYEEEKELDKQW